MMGHVCWGKFSCYSCLISRVSYPGSSEGVIKPALTSLGGREVAKRSTVVPLSRSCSFPQNTGGIWTNGCYQGWDIQGGFGKKCLFIYVNETLLVTDSRKRQAKRALSSPVNSPVRPHFILCVAHPWGGLSFFLPAVCVVLKCTLFFFFFEIFGGTFYLFI